MATPVEAPSGAATTKHAGSRGKNQIHWSEHVWEALDCAVTAEMMRARMAAKFLPHVHVEKKQTTVASDMVILPGPPAAGAIFDPALSVDESQTNRVNEYWVSFKMSVSQVEEEENAEAAMGQHTTARHQEAGVGGEHHHVAPSYRASTGVSLAMLAANRLAQAEDLVLFNGQNAFNSLLFTGPGGGVGPLIQYLDPKLATNLDYGLLNIVPAAPGAAGGNIVLPNASQVIPVHPTVAGTAITPPMYAEASLNAIASGVSQLQQLGHYENYALVLHTIPYADIHQALKTTLIEPVVPIGDLIKAGIYGTGTLPPFTPVVPGPPPIAGAPPAVLGLPSQIAGVNIAFPATLAGLPAGSIARVLYTGVLVSLSGNTMDLVRGKMDDNLDVIVTFNQKDPNEQYRFRVVHRHCLRLKDSTAVCVLLFLDS